MSRFLHISVRFYEGRYHGAGAWPPSPARLFQALVAGAARGATLNPSAVAALTWLEELPPPRIAAPHATPGRTFIPFVPNNDLDAVSGDPSRRHEVRVAKPTRSFLFDSDQPLVYCWQIPDDAPADARAVCEIVDQLYQLGRGIDPAWAAAAILESEEAESLLFEHPGILSVPAGAGDRPCPGPGTLTSLIERHAAGLNRFSRVSGNRPELQGFVQPPKPWFRLVNYDARRRVLDYDLRGDQGFAPRPLHSVYAVATSLRDGAAARLSQALPELAGDVERFVVGRGAGASDLNRRIRIIPLPSIGTEHTDPSVRRVRIEVPPACPIPLDDLRWAFDGLQARDPETGERWDGRLVSAEDTGMSERYCGKARVFRSVTPVALPAMHTRAHRELPRGSGSLRRMEHQHACTAVRQALRHLGERTRPEVVAVRREPFHAHGLRAESFVPGSRFPARSLWHVEIQFPAPVEGPLVIGNGRFCGLGLMAPVTIYRDVLVFDMPPDTHVSQKDGPYLVGAFRRAIMSRARDSRGRIPTLFSGHEPDGSPARPGNHAHMFLAADPGPGPDANGDGRVRRLVVAAPWTVDRRSEPRSEPHSEPHSEPEKGQRARFDRIVSALTEVVAGRLGRLRFKPPQAPAEDDPLTLPSRVWRSVTPFVATRNMRGGLDAPDDFVKTDVVNECARRGLPVPKGVQVLNAAVGPRGGSPTARLEIEFTTAVSGPLMLGRSSHFGGGLFHAVPPKSSTT